MPNLILIKHAKPHMDESRPSSQWSLSEAGRQQAAALAERLRDRAIDRVITSDEPKADETGRIVADTLGVPCESAPDLHEHDRSNVPVMPTRDFISMMALFFKEPNRLVLGRETARAALDRIVRAIDSAIHVHADKNIAVVTHGTVLSLYAAGRVKEDPFQLWRRMGLPSFLVLDRLDQRLIERVDSLV